MTSFTPPPMSSGEELAKQHPADIAEVLRRADDESRIALFKALPRDVAAEVLTHLEGAPEATILHELSETALSELLEVMPSDAAADVVGDLEPDVQDHVLELMEEEESVGVRQLLEYAPESAGGIMATELLAVDEHETVSETIEEVRRHGQAAPDIAMVYVTDTHRHLLGTISLQSLILASPQSPAREIMDSEVIDVPAEMDQEEVARIVSKYDLLEVPVVDDHHCLLGVVTVDDVIDVIRAEDTEDMFRLAGSDDAELMDRSAMSVARIRLPWLAITMLGSLLSCSLIKYYQLTLERAIALAFFVPVIMAMGGNIGIQSSVITVRGLATGRLSFHEVGRVMARETRVGLIMGIICGAIGAVAATFLGEQPAIGIVVGLAMFIAIVVASIMGVMVPMLFKRFDIDPAIASGPFVTTANDITGLLIYFSLATWLLRVAVS